MDVMGEQVRHGQFGVGTVTGQTAATVTVRFGEEYGEKKFLYPSAFGRFLELCDPAAKARMEETLSQIQVRLEAERKRREAENEARRRKREGGSRTEQKPAAVKKRAPARKAAAKSAKRPKDPEPEREED